MTTKSPSKPRKKHVYPLRFRPHPGQREVHNSKARFRVVACGRQWGKTRYACAWALQKAVAGGKGWWVAPDAIVADIGWETIRKLASQVPGAEIQDSYPRTVTFPSGGWLQVKGAHLPGKLRGRTLDFLVVDEAAFIQNGDRWHSELRPTLAVKGGEALFVSTFNGENWFYELYERGQDPDFPEWESWRKPSIENPYFPPAELELARVTTPEAEFEQEYMANPLVYVGAVFNGELVQRAIDEGHDVAYDPSLATYAGLDWGFTNDTALELCQETVEGEVRWFHEELWQATELNKRCRVIAERCVSYGVRVVFADAAGATENRTLADHLDHAGAVTAIKPIPFGKYKDAGISARRWYLENGLEVLGNEKLAADTKRYRYKEGKEEVEKVSDHTVDAATAFYASRRRVLSSVEAA